MQTERGSEALTEVCEQLRQHRLPRWQELPELELYMDQVLSLVGRYLGGYPGFDEKGLTASMVNNYVKQGALPPPRKKRYSRTHLARLLMICVLKASLPIAAIKELLPEETRTEEFYDRFCDLFEDGNRETAQAHIAQPEPPLPEAACRA
ncbi:MAG: DUF1836 domain-containing protein, partial [Oscillospiraceae bacterium]|nr:DUF1836 domain-containing protein [Oscillospiraceae bacterium]